MRLFPYQHLWTSIAGHFHHEKGHQRQTMTSQNGLQVYHRDSDILSLLLDNFDTQSHLRRSEFAGFQGKEMTRGLA